jgi:uncharacterized membrane protein YfcA
VTGRNIMLLVIVNGFVAFFCYRMYQQGMPISRTLIFAVISFIGVNLAAELGRRLGERRTRQVAARKAGPTSSRKR